MLVVWQWFLWWLPTADNQAPVVHMSDSAIHLINHLYHFACPTKTTMLPSLDTCKSLYSVQVLWKPINCSIHWIEIYSLDNAIHLLNNGDQKIMPQMRWQFMMKCVIPFFLSDGLDLQYWRKCYWHCDFRQLKCTSFNICLRWGIWTLHYY